MAAPGDKPGPLEIARMVLVTVVIAAVGGYLFHLIDFPAPWISGGMVAVAAAALWGVKVGVPPLLREFVFFILGVSIGSAISPETLSAIALWPVSMFILLASIPVVTYGTSWVLMRLRGWNRDDALLGAAPGSLNMVLIIADQIGASVPKIAMVQTLRLAILVFLLPLLVGTFSDLSQAPEAVGEVAELELWELALVVAASLVGALAARLVRMPTAMLLGAMVGSGVLYGSGVVAAPVPDFIMVPGFIVVGAYIGTRFAGLTISSILVYLVDGLYAFVTSFTLSAAAAGLVTLFVGISFGQTVLGFAPGGFEVMIVLAFSLGMDAAYVAIHQTTRFFALSVTLPFLFRSKMKR